MKLEAMELATKGPEEKMDAQLLSQYHDVCKSIVDIRLRGGKILVGMTVVDIEKIISKIRPYGVVWDVEVQEKLCNVYRDAALQDRRFADVLEIQRPTGATGVFDDKKPRTSQLAKTDGWKFVKYKSTTFNRLRLRVDVRR